jgi:hypothetical protein
MSLFDDWGPQDSFPLRVKQLPTAELSKLSFLFGGVGDGTISRLMLIGLLMAFYLSSTRLRDHYWSP